jgi:mycofactocin system glycosyltransferase
VSARAKELPDGFVVRLHDEVELGTFMTYGAQVVRLTESAKSMLSDRAVRVGSPASSRLAGQLLDLDLAQPVVDDLTGPVLTDVTIIVPVRDNHLGVDRLLAACGAVVECVIVDDASRDPKPLAEVVTRHGARLVRLDRNVGPAAARNAGLSVIRTPYAAFIDSDVHVTSEVVRRLMAHFVDPGLAAVAPRIVSVGGRGWPWPYERDCGSLDLGSRSASTRPWTRVSYVPSACMIARVADLGTGFDPTMRSGEDVDLVWRLNASGLRVRHAAEVSVHHDTRPTMIAWLRRKAFYGTSAAPLARRHGNRMAPAVLAPSTGIAIAGLAVQRRWSLVVAAVAAATTAAQIWSQVPDLPAAERRQLVRATVAGIAGQTSGLVLRHWSPLTLALCARSRRARRVVGVLAVVDGVLAHRAAHPALDVARFTLARRAEHLAYGLGVWIGAVRDRSIRCLVPKWLPSRSRGTRG